MGVNVCVQFIQAPLPSGLQSIYIYIYIYIYIFFFLNGKFLLKNNWTKKQHNPQKTHK
jgi:hypothetical protein